MARNGFFKITSRLADAQLDILITNELPFGPWIADRKPFDRQTAQASIDVHAVGLDALAELNIPSIVSSRPVWSADRLINQAIVLEGGQIRAIHTKQYIPEEPADCFNPTDISSLRMGVMLCTDAMFNEHARHYGRQGTVLIAIPRAAGTSTDNWLTAGRMAALLVSGSYVVSSNRYGRSKGGTVFGGTGFAFGPGGISLSTTDSTNPLLVVDVKPELAARQRSEYFEMSDMDL
ncbi:carbon-nitrogen hydrolase [Lipomyces starkeyi]|uniref:CN hydrolase domain-containing protein n=1 Tax=Lipomyces starkeyi NRRL Y-11557 TaxID=675824 RepID=A0A1E3QCG5_LIPST|nr:hypothetical protein LIPSTDRAFT_26328 [Lipomyces starkeyi NRRL Y-11557]